MNQQTATAAPASFAEIFETCVGCGICRDYCPVFVDLFALSAERAAGRAPHDAITLHADKIAQSCYFCGRCETSCPIDLPLEAMAWERLREQNETTGVSRRLKWSSDADRLLRWRARLAWLLALGTGFIRKIAEKITGIDARVPLPARGRPRLAKWWKTRARPQPDDAAPRVAVFAGCMAGYGESGEARALVEILERSGCRVELLAHESCCGAPEFAAARADAAAGKLGAVLGQLERACESGGEVIVIEGACLKMLRRDGRRVRGDMARADKIRISDAGEYLWRLHRQGRLAAPARALEGRAAWQASCAAQTLSDESAGLKLLRQIPGLETLRLGAACCGMGGAWGMRAENYERSRAFCESGAGRALEESGARILAGECASCRAHLTRGVSGIRVSSPIELYRESLDAE